MVKKIIRSYLINIFALWVVSQYISGFHLNQGIRSLLLVGLGFTILHLVIKPILDLILGSINFLTLGLVGLLIDGGILYALTFYFPQISVSPWSFSGLKLSGIVIPPYDFNLILTIVICAAIINIIRLILNLIS